MPQLPNARAVRPLRLIFIEYSRSVEQNRIQYTRLEAGVCDLRTRLGTHERWSANDVSSIQGLRF